LTTQYYYLVASLPGLIFSAPASVSRAVILEECRRHLSPADMAELDALVGARRLEVSMRFSREWMNSEGQLRNAIARTRALRAGVDEKKYVKDHEGYRMDVEAAVDDAYSRVNPMERELALDRFRWNLADELSAGDPFGLSAVLSYAVKLGINERWQSLTPEAGQQRLEEMVGIVGVSSQELSGWSGLAQM